MLEVFGGSGSTVIACENTERNQMYFSITQLNNLITQKGFCPIEMLLLAPSRTARYLSASIARNLTNFLKKTDRFAKTIVFCADQEHAKEMRRALN